MHRLKGFSKFLDVCEKIARTIAVIFMVLILALTLYQVFARYLFKAQTWWAEQLCRYMFIWMMMLYMPVIIRHGQNLGFDMLINKFSEKVQNYFWLVCEFLMGAFGGFYAYYTIILSQKYFKIHKVFEGLNWECWWLYLIQAVAGIFIVIYSIEVIYKRIRKIKGKEGGAAA